jgi:hypothetical protein
MSQFDVRSAGTRQPSPPHRRVREEVRDGLAVAAASVLASVVVTVLAALLLRLAS